MDDRQRRLYAKPTPCFKTRVARKRTYSARLRIFSTVERRKLELACKGAVEVVNNLCFVERQMMT